MSESTRSEKSPQGPPRLNSPLCVRGFSENFFQKTGGGQEIYIHERSLKMSGNLKGAKNDLLRPLGRSLPAPFRKEAGEEWIQMGITHPAEVLDPPPISQRTEFDRHLSFQEGIPGWL